MSKTYIIADLHGRFDLLEKALDRIEADSPEGGTVVFTGDYIDRGPQSKQILNKLIKGPVNPNWKWVNLMGNHERFMIDAYAGHGEDFWILYNGGYATTRSYGVRNSSENAAFKYFPEEHIIWLMSLPLYYNDGKRMFVHAYVDPTIDIKFQNEDVLVWHLYEPYTIDVGYWDNDLNKWLYVVHGHHQFEDGPLIFENRANFDTLAWYTGRLVVGVFDDDKEGGPIKTLEIKGAPIKKHIDQLTLLGEYE